MVQMVQRLYMTISQPYNDMKLLQFLKVEYIATTFNTNTRKTIHIIIIYKPSTLSLLIVIHLQIFFGSNVKYLSHDNN